MANSYADGEEDERTNLLSDDDKAYGVDDILVTVVRSDHEPKFRQVLASLVACLAPLAFGFTLGYTSPAIPSMESHGFLNEKAQQSWFGSLISVGAIFGGPIAAVCIGIIGRKGTLLGCGIPFVLGWFLIIAARGPLQSEAWKLGLLFGGRILSGIGTGMASLVAPVYIAEISTKDLRGFLGSCNQLSVCLGILLAYCLGFKLEWWYLAVAGQVVVVVLVLWMLFMVETPRWFVSKGQESAAMHSLRWLRGDAGRIQQEYNEIQTNLNMNQEPVSLSDFKKASLLRPLLISLCLMIFQQMSGINAVIFYCPSIFEKAQFFEGNPLAPSAIVATVQVLATFLASVLMDRLGRRFLLMLASTFMCLSCVTMGVYYYLMEHNIGGNISWLSLVSLLVYISAFSLGWGPIPWLIMSEIFPVRARGLASGMATCLNWTMVFVVTKNFYDMQETMKPYGAFWLFGGFCALSGVFVALTLPETKGKTLEEIEEHFSGRTPRTLN